MSSAAAGIGRVGNLLPGQKRTEVVPRPVDYHEITTPIRGQEIYNPDPDQEVIAEFNGERYRIPPRGERLVFRDPFTLAETQYPKPGVCPIRDYTVMVHGKRYVYLAKDIIKFFCGEDGRSGTLSPLGVRPLFGDNGEKDAAARADAEQAWAGGKDGEARQIVTNHEEAVAFARDTGGSVPRPTARVLWAYDWLDSRDAEALLPYSCAVCNQGFKDERSMLVHTVARHKKHPAAQDAARALNLQGETGNVGVTNPTPAPPAPTEADVQRILEQREREDPVEGLTEDALTGAAAAPAVAAGPDEDDDDGEGEDEDRETGDPVGKASAPGLPPPPATSRSNRKR
jgi:hypothetical protein